MRSRSTARSEPCAVRSLQCRPVAVHRHRPRRPCAHGRCRPDAPALLLRLGHPHRRARRGALQSDVLSQRLDLAARQCADRARSCALWPEAFGRGRSSRACSTPRPTWTCADCRNCSAASSANDAAARRSYPVACAPQAWASATPFSPARGSARNRILDVARGEIRFRNPRLPAFLQYVILRDLRLGESSVDLCLSQTRERCRWKCCEPAVRSRYRSY